MHMSMSNSGSVTKQSSWNVALGIKKALLHSNKQTSPDAFRLVINWRESQKECKERLLKTGPLRITGYVGIVLANTKLDYLM